MKPVLIIMAAGMGSRYGGLKQIDPVDEEGNLIIDFSIYDAIHAGFEKIVFIIKKEIEEDFKERIGNRLAERIEVVYVYQELDKLPFGFTPPEGRMKPWGTGHAILCCKDIVTGPFAVINADDYYGREAFIKIYRALEDMKPEVVDRYFMVGYPLKNTLTLNGYVARGVCRINEEGALLGIKERTKIISKEGRALYLEGDGENWEELSMNSVVSMNLWGFGNGFFQELEARFKTFLETEGLFQPLSAEYFLPTVVDELIVEQRAVVQVLHSQDRWYGVTYKEDKPVVIRAIHDMKRQGSYPERLWS